jgi:hypothetical protein
MFPQSVQDHLREFAMKDRTVVEAGLLAAVAIFITAAQAGEKAGTIDPGFVPDTGQINAGSAPKLWSDAPPQSQPPSQEEARAALMMLDNGIPSAGEAGPIGATMQTMPEKFSNRNKVLDNVPTTAWPLSLNEQQREQIYKAVMAEKSQPADDAPSLKPGDFLTYEQTLDEHPLPPAVATIDGLQGLEYVKAKDKVLLVRPPNGFVVDEISS